MRAEELLHIGELEEALKQLTNQVQSDPTDVKKRVFLFQLLVLLGKWRRASTQLDVIKDLDDSTTPFALTYKEVIKCELERLQVFSGENKPQIVGENENWMVWQLDALSQQVGGNVLSADKTREKAYNSAPETAGTLNGHPFKWIADADSRFGPMLELFLDGKYCWTAFSSIEYIKIAPPKDLRDYVWMPATMKMFNSDPIAEVFIPARYPGTEASDDVSVKKALLTKWEPKSESTFEGVGLRIFVTDEAEFSVLDMREIIFQTKTQHKDQRSTV